MALPSEVKLLIACGGIFFSFSYFAVLQEDVYKKVRRRPACLSRSTSEHH